MSIIPSNFGHYLFRDFFALRLVFITLSKSYLYIYIYINGECHKDSKQTFENVTQIKYFGTIVTNQNLIQVEIKRRLQFSPVFSSVKKRKNYNIQNYNIPVVLYGCESLLSNIKGGTRIKGV
jgi:hypothetical protein